MSETAMTCALNYLSRRALTTSELVVRLQRKGFSEQDIRGVVERLKEWGYLDDRAYALRFSRAHLSQEPRQKVLYKLLQKGIALEIAEQAITEAYSPERERELCRKLAQNYWQMEKERWLKKHRSLTPCQFEFSEERFPVQVFRAKVGSKLWQKGFAPEIINQCLDELQLDD